MKNTRTAFQDAMMQVGTANTSTYLKNRLINHPIAIYLDDSFTKEELASKINEEISSFDRTLQKITIIYLLFMALSKKEENSSILKYFIKKSSSSKIPWLNELAEINKSPPNKITNTIISKTFKNPISTSTSNENNEFSQISINS
ncbi:hypothetical protein [Acidovorax sp. A1169]|uniref:hypothetical protein n=1 Tax=Acidovorax sp. A1169 TaxID=3059524 RepID=UPI0027378E0C|nr:hypothetical protein [Acidovorax sp. A1169]MDP4078758.1 hypothetical protein [Acidovorax sp. A1169]